MGVVGSKKERFIYREMVRLGKKDQSCLSYGNVIVLISFLNALEIRTYARSVQLDMML